MQSKSKQRFQERAGMKTKNCFMTALSFLNVALHVQCNSYTCKAEHSTWHSQCLIQQLLRLLWTILEFKSKQIGAESEDSFAIKLFVMAWVEDLGSAEFFIMEMLTGLPSQGWGGNMTLALASSLSFDSICLLGSNSPSVHWYFCVDN